MQQKSTLPSIERTTSIKLNHPASDPNCNTFQLSPDLEQESSFAVPLGREQSPSSSLFNLVTPRRARATSRHRFETQRKVKPKWSNHSDEREVRWKNEEKHDHNMKNVVHLSELVKIFLEKININNTSRPPLEFDPLQEKPDQRQELLCQVKLQLPQTLDHILTVLKMVFILAFSFAFPLSLLYHQVAQSLLVLLLKALALLLSLFDLFDSLQPHSDPYLPVEESKLTSRQQKVSILWQFTLTCMILVSMIITGSSPNLGTYLLGGLLGNLIRYQKGVVRLESRFLAATHYQKYWDLVKVLAINLLVCHLLACVLIGVSQVGQQTNWMQEKGIDNTPWYQQYIWSYYFGTTIILTIGFGDLHAANYIQAFVIITISLFACLFFGYNLNYIGNLISLIRIDEQEKLERLKLFGNLSSKARITSELKSDITNFIIQEAELKKISTYSQERKLLDELPSSLKSNFLQQANNRLFNHLLQLVRLTKKTVENLSENIQTRICHPQEMIKRHDGNLSLIILQSGEVGFASRVKGVGKLNNLVIERISCGAQDESKLVCIDILQNQRINYDIKSLSYSVIYHMEEEAWQKTLALNREDYELYKQLKDKCRYRIVQFGITLCKFCNKKHTLFECPRLHFLPFRRILPNNLQQKHLDWQPRVNFSRQKKICNVEVTEKAKNTLSFGSFSQEIEDLVKANEIAGIKKREKANSELIPYKRSSYLRTKEVVTQLREELKKMQKEDEKIHNFQFTLWLNDDCDSAYDFTYYFPRDNPGRLAERQAKKGLLNLSRSMKKKGRKQLDKFLTL